MNNIKKWIKNNKKISIFIIAFLTLLIFFIYPGNDITCLDISPSATPDIQSARAGDVLQIGLPHSERKLTLIFIPEGSYPSAKSGHHTEITYPYWLGKYEVTQEEWEKVTGWIPIPELEKRWPIATGARYPMCQVSYDECLDFCDQLTAAAQQQGVLPEGYCFSLPTEAQWELAYSCGKEIVLPRNLEKIAWTNHSHVNTGAYPAGQKEPNAWGFHDMLGNVWELCADFYHSRRLHGSNPVNWKTDTGNLSTNAGLSVTCVGGDWFSPIADGEKEIPRRKCYADSRSAFTGLRVALVPVQQHQLLKKRLKRLHPVPEWVINIRNSFELIYMYIIVYWKTLTNL